MWTGVRGDGGRLMFDRLIDLIVQFFEAFRLSCVICHYERAVVLRLGKFNREIGPGFHLLLPLYIETVMRDSVVLQTATMLPQSLATKDEKSIVISAVISYKISGIRTFLLEIEGEGQVLVDCTYGHVEGMVRGHTWQESRTMDFAAELTKLVRRKAKRWGVDIVEVQLRDFSRSRSVRLWIDQHEPRDL